MFCICSINAENGKGVKENETEKKDEERKERETGESKAPGEYRGKERFSHEPRGWRYCALFLSVSGNNFSFIC
jgi:hypothetical protein